MLLNAAMLEVVNVCDRSSEKFRGNPLQDTFLASPRQKYLLPKVQFLGISLVKACGGKLVKLN
jgi:hypothetical protein